MPAIAGNTFRLVIFLFLLFVPFVQVDHQSVSEKMRATKLGIGL
jgi:hypothetical protein